MSSVKGNATRSFSLLVVPVDRFMAKRLRCRMRVSGRRVTVDCMRMDDFLLQVLHMTSDTSSLLNWLRSALVSEPSQALMFSDST